jgi:hypothetical protein
MDVARIFLRKQNGFHLKSTTHNDVFVVVVVVGGNNVRGVFSIVEEGFSFFFLLCIFFDPTISSKIQLFFHLLKSRIINII